MSLLSVRCTALLAAFSCVRSWFQAGTLAHPVLVGALGCGEFAGLLCCAVTDPAATTSANTPSAIMSERNMEDSFRPGVAARRLCVDVRHFDSYMVDILPSRRRSENRAHFGRG